MGIEDINSNRAKDIRTNPGAFDGILSGADTDVQKALETIDEAIKSTITYYFDSYDVGKVWDTDPAKMSDGDEDTYAKATTGVPVWEDYHLLDANECDGTDLGTITKVEIRVKHYELNIPGDNTWLMLLPSIGALIGDTVDIANYGYPSVNPVWSPWIDITSFANYQQADPDLPPAVDWTWAFIQDLNVEVLSINYASDSTVEMYAAKVEVKVTYKGPAKSETLDSVCDRGSITDRSITTGGLKIGAANQILFGPDNTTGSWKIVIDGSALVFYRYSGSDWVEKGAMY